MDLRTKVDSLICVFLMSQVVLCYAISWKLITKPAVFGSEIELYCSVDNDTATINKSRQWSKGEQDNVLVINGKTINDTKYSENFNKSLHASILTIQALDTNDVNIPYTCHYGFQKFKNILDTKTEDFEYHPQGNGAYFHHNSTELLLKMVFDQVYPEPKCTAEYGKTNVTDMLNITSVPKDFFFTVAISLHFHHISKECVHHGFYLTCFVGTKKIIQRFEPDKDICMETHSEIGTLILFDAEKDQTLGQIGRAIFTLTTIFYCLIIPAVIAYSRFRN